MGEFLIIAAVLAIAAWIFKNVWELALKFFYYFILGVVGVINSLVTAVRRGRKVCYILWYKVKEKFFKKEIPAEEGVEVDVDDVPTGLLDELNSHDEVIVKKGTINRNEF